MNAYNMLEAKNSLSKLVDAVESGAVAEIVIARNGKPAARVVPIREKGAFVQFGTCRGEFIIGDDIDADNDEIADLFDPTLPKTAAN